ncbi:MAG: hypothetical protein QOJ60_268 [Actinomycetota bacterium]|nr:hypothetical protein [Actinomycetota bacterium]
MSMFTPPGVGGRRARGPRSRTGRRAVVVVISLLVVAGLAAGSWWYAGRNESEAAPTPKHSCPAPAPTPSLVSAHAIRVNIYNATQRRGLAAHVADLMRRRHFRIGRVDNDPLNRRVTGVAELRSSARGAGAARTVAAQVSSAVAVRDRRKNATVDLVIGAAFRRLVTPSQAAAALRPTTTPRPSGC